MASREIGVSHPRHKLWYRSFMAFARTFMLPVAKRMYHIKTRKDKRKMPVPCIMLYNHISNYDYMCNIDVFRPYIRYMISDAMLRNRVNAIVFPLVTDFIFRRKGERADDAVESAIVTIQDGVCVGIAPEGGVTCNGTTEAIRPRTGTLVKQCDCGMVTIAQHGGYFIYPTWARFKAKGPIYANVIGIYSKEELESKTAEEINEIIARDIHVNHYEWMKKERIIYKRKNRAEWMERVTGICPKCNSVDSMHSCVDDLYCEKCGYKVSVDEYGLFQGEDAIFDNLYDWDMWQRGYLQDQRQKWLDSPDEIITTDEHMQINILKDNFPVLIDGDARVEIDTKEMRFIGEKVNLVMPLREISGVVSSIADGYGVAYKDEYYQIKAPRPLWNDKMRYVRKIILGESIGVKPKDDTL